MAYNALYGYDTALQGYGRANTPGATTQGRQRQYPAWMTDMNARGIGEAQDYTPTVPGFIEIPRYIAPPPIAQAQEQTAPQAMGFTADTRQAEGGFGAANDQVGNRAAPGYLGDVLGGLGLSTGTYGGIGGGMADGLGLTGNEQMGHDANAAAGNENASAQGSVDAASAMDGLWRGGAVTANRLRGPNPPGPDDGFAALDIGEGVMTAAAMKHYGPAFLARLNKLQVPKGSSNNR